METGGDVCGGSFVDQELLQLKLLKKIIMVNFNIWYKNFVELLKQNLLEFNPNFDQLIWN